MKLKSILSIAVSALILSTSVPRTDTIASVADTSMRDMTTMEIVTDMGIGINLGNTFESCGDWDNRPIWTGY